jgi:hypothetical protein
MMRPSETSAKAPRVAATFVKTCRHYKIRNGGAPRSRSPAKRWFAGNATEVAVRKSDRRKEDKQARRAKIRALNDAFRKSFGGGRVMMTAGVAALEAPVRNAVVAKIQVFDAFDDDNDPSGEHDFVSIELDGQTFFAKIDSYDRDCVAHSKDAADPEKTCRVMTIMLAEEY